MSLVHRYGPDYPSCPTPGCTNDPDVDHDDRIDGPSYTRRCAECREPMCDQHGREAKANDGCCAACIADAIASAA